MTAEASGNPTNPNDKDLLIRNIRSIEETAGLLSEATPTIIQGVTIGNLNIYELNESLSAVGQLNKRLSVVLDQVAELKSELTRELRRKTRAQLGNV